MRYWIASGLTLWFAYACSSTTTKLPDSDDGGSGGAPELEGGAGADGGTASSRAGSGGNGSPKGGSAGTVAFVVGGEGGAGPGTAGTNGSSGSAGEDAGAGTGGTGGTGGTSSNAGGTDDGGAGPITTGGTPACLKASECVNPHRPTCSMTCDDGVCEAAPSIAVSASVQSGPRDVAPRTGFWDDSGNAYIVYPGIGTEPSISIYIQALDEEGLLRGEPKSFATPDGVSVVDMVAADFSGGRLGLLWHGTREADYFDVTEFSVTDLSGADGPSMRLSTADSRGIYPDEPYNFFLHALPSNRWLTVTYTGSGPRWRGYVATAGSPPSDEPLFTGLADAPWSVTGRSHVKGNHQGYARIGDRFFVSGFDCEWSGVPGCEPVLVFQAFDVSSMTAAFDDFVALSTTSYPMEDLKQRAPALGELDGKLAALWTQYADTGALLLGRGIFETDGTVATMRRVEPSDLIPKAIVESPAGGALLIASRVNSSGAEPIHTLVAQRLDANLDFIGSPHPVSVAGEEPTAVQLTPSGDGRVLLTFRQSYAQHRILHADLCQ